VIRRASVAVAAAILCFCLAAFPVGAAGPPIEIDVITSLTGGATFIGQTHQKTLQTLEALVNKQGGINGQPLHFAFYDDQTNPQVAVQLANQIIAKKPPIFIGSVFIAMCRAVMPLVVNGPVQFCVSPSTSPPKDSYTFSASVSSRDEMYATLRFFRTKGWTRFATITTTDASGQDADNAIADGLKFAENKSMTLVDAEHFNPTDISISAQMTKLKSLAPQAVIVFCVGTPFGTAVHGMHDAGIDIPTMTASAVAVNAQLKGYAGLLPTHLYFTGLEYAAGVADSKATAAAQKTFFDAMKAAGLPADLQAGLPWDSGLIVVDALRHSGPNPTAEQLHAYIENLHNFAGIHGTYDFRDGSQRGLTQKGAVMIEWQPNTDSYIASSGFGGGI
jgi:branched-chain amino acid transport system substrate-binding protein